MSRRPWNQSSRLPVRYRTPTRGQESDLLRQTAEEQALFATRFAGQLLVGGAVLTMLIAAVLGLNGGGPFSPAWFVTYGACLVAGASGVALLALRRPAPDRVLLAIPPAAAAL